MSEHAIFTVRLATAQGLDDFPVGPAELFHFGRAYPGLNIDEALRTGSWEHLLFLAWRSAKRRKVTDLDLDAWVDTLEGLDIEHWRSEVAALVQAAAVPLGNGASPRG